MATANDRPGIYLPTEILEHIRDIIRVRKDNMFDELMHVNPKFDDRDVAYRASYSPEKYAAINKDLASCAAVNRDWQAAFEPAAFRHIALTIDTRNKYKQFHSDFNAGTLHQSDQVASFSSVFAPPQRRQYLRWVHLRLQTVNHFQSQFELRTVHEMRNKGMAQHGHDEVYFMRAIWRLYSVLKFWRVGRDTDGGITLELSAVDRGAHRSEFLVQPFFRTWDRFADVDGWITKHETENRQRTDWTSRLAPVRMRRKRRSTDFQLEAFRYFGRDHHRPTERMPLPSVACVRRFVVTRECIFPLSPLFMLLPLLDALPRLESVQYEPWWWGDTFKQLRYQSEQSVFLMHLFT